MRPPKPSLKGLPALRRRIAEAAAEAARRHRLPRVAPVFLMDDESGEIEIASEPGFTVLRVNNQAYLFDGQSGRYVGRRDVPKDDI